MNIFEYPAQELRNENKPILEITEDLKQVTQEMLRLMKNRHGVGLAGPQIGLNYQVCVMDILGSKKLKNIVMINPKITSSTPHRPSVDIEACLSLPGISIYKRRANECTVTYTDIDNKQCKLRLKNYDARVIQHELDHLSGRLITDR